MLGEEIVMSIVILVRPSYRHMRLEMFLSHVSSLISWKKKGNEIVV
jgi:hypothetical protein